MRGRVCESMRERTGWIKKCDILKGRGGLGREARVGRPG